MIGSIFSCLESRAFHGGQRSVDRILSQYQGTDGIFVTYAIIWSADA
jgi:hypothetical protein